MISRYHGERVLYENYTNWAPDGLDERPGVYSSYSPEKYARKQGVGWGRDLGYSIRGRSPTAPETG